MITAKRAPLASAFFICDLKLPPPQCSSTRKPGITQRSATCQREAAGRFALVHHVDIRRRAAGTAARCSCQQRQQALDAHRETAGRRRLAADLLDQAVVAAAGAHRALRAEPVGHPFEHGAVVIVQPAHQARIDVEMRCRPRAAMPAAPRNACSESSSRSSSKLRRRLDQRLHRRILAVEHAQRIAVQAALRIVVQRSGMLLADSAISRAR